MTAASAAIGRTGILAAISAFATSFITIAGKTHGTAELGHGGRRQMRSA